MRAFYATHKNIRVFVLGVPEGWHVGVYDLDRKQWTEMNGPTHDTLKGAKSAAVDQMVTIIGKMTPAIKWH